MSRIGFGYLLLNLLGLTSVIGGTEPIGLPKYYPVGVSTVSFRLYAECRFRNTNFRIMCWLSRPILLRMIATMRGTDPTGPPECRWAEWSTNWGCSMETNLLRVVTTSGWIASHDLFECCLTGWSTIELDFLTRVTSSGYNHRVKYSDLTWWSATLWLSSSLRSSKKAK